VVSGLIDGFVPKRAERELESREREQRES